MLIWCVCVCVYIYIILELCFLNVCDFLFFYFCKVGEELHAYTMSMISCVAWVDVANIPCDQGERVPPIGHPKINMMWEDLCFHTINAQTKNLKWNVGLSQIVHSIWYNIQEHEMKQLDSSFSITCHRIAFWIILLLLPSRLNGALGLSHAKCAMLVTQVER